jgi:PPIC-type PPIASE domain
MTIDTLPKARNVLNQLQHGADFGKLAKANSQDATTSSKGGDLGWLPRGQYTQTTQQAVVENWLFGVDGGQRKLNEISPILTENGAYHIVQILGFDPSRAVDPTELKSLQQNALTNWILSRHALPDTKIVPIDQDKLLDPLNMPPDLPVSAPGQQPGAPGGLPGGPGGQPGQP